MSLSLFAFIFIFSGYLLIAGEERFSKEQLKARFYYDLGPSQIDVSVYPKDQREKYVVFERACSQCHTLARPINSPIVKQEDWKRFVQRMHGKTKTRPKTEISKTEAKAIVDFLAYDSQIRKVGKKEEFEAITAQLKQLFEEARKEEVRLQEEEGRQKARPSAPYTGDRPRN